MRTHLLRRVIALLLCAVCLALPGRPALADAPARLEIWSEPAGFRADSKLADMNIDAEASPFTAAVTFSDAIVGADYFDAESAIDTYTYFYEIRSGYEAETYEDRPWLEAFPVPEGDAAVIILPGGGFACKSADGSGREGADVAALLNACGVNAFVLHYRANPYEYPIPFLDLQRAVRYLRANASSLHLDPDKLALLGFSAGGTVAATFAHVIRGGDFFPADYVPDAIDAADDAVRAVALIYPALSFRDNVNMLFALFDADAVRAVESRVALLEQTELRRYLSPEAAPEFIAYGTADDTVGTAETLRYCSDALALGCDVTVLAAEGQAHGFGPDCYWAAFRAWLDRIFF